MHSFSDMSSAELLSLLEVLPFALLLFDDEGRIVMANTHIQNTIHLDLGASDMHDVFWFFHVALEGSQEKQSFFDMPHIDKEVFQKKESVAYHSLPIEGRYFDIQIFPFHDSGKAVLLLTDVTRLKEIDDFKTEFLSMTFHQLKTPLAGINWTLDLFLNGEVGNVSLEQKEYLQELKIRNKRMMKLVNQLLHVSHIESAPFVARPEHIVLEDIVSEAIDDLLPLLKEKKTTLHFTPSHQKHSVFLDQNLLYQVIHNLLTNAIRYSSGNENALVSVDIQEQNDMYTIQVKDNGIGIPEQAQKDVFKKFFRADNAQKKETDGTGLDSILLKK